MKTLYALIVLLLLVPLASFGGETPTLDEPLGNLELLLEEPPLQTPAPEAGIPNGLPGTEPMAFPKPNPCPGDPILDCTRWNSSFCTYRWDSCSFCCKPIYIAPGAHCPNICV